MMETLSLWHKSWLESRVRFFGAAALMFLVVAWEVYDAEHGMSRFDRRTPRSHFTSTSHSSSEQSSNSYGSHPRSC